MKLLFWKKIWLRFCSRSSILHIRYSGLERTQLTGFLKSSWDTTYPQTICKLMAKPTMQCSTAFPSIHFHLRYSKMQSLYILLLKHTNLNKKITTVTPIVINRIINMWQLTESETRGFQKMLLSFRLFTVYHWVLQYITGSYTQQCTQNTLSDCSKGQCLIVSVRLKGLFS